jgi:hypothetical protein
MDNKTEDYNEGFEHGLMYAQENMISQQALEESFDKFLDVINEYKKVIVLTKKHFEGISVNNTPLSSKKEIEQNVFALQNVIETTLKKSMKKDKSYGQTKEV